MNNPVLSYSNVISELTKFNSEGLSFKVNRE